jgi:MFS family permease
LSSDSAIASERDFRRAIRARYFRAFVAPAPLGILATGLLANLLFHNWAIDRLSDRFGWYRSMTVILFVLSIDFYVLCLISLAESTFQTYRTAGIFRDLHVAGVKPWNALRPFLGALIVLLLADTMIEGLVTTFIEHEPARLAAFGFLITLLYAFPAALFLASLILAMNLFNLPKLVQFFISLLLGFLAVLMISSLSDAWQPGFSRWNPDESNSAILKDIVQFAGASWNLFAMNYASYAAMFVQAVILALLSVPLYLYVRRLAHRKFSSL